MTARISASHGAFVVLEGPDGSGTTTHAATLAEALGREHARVFRTAEPTSGPIGSAIRGFLKSGDLPPNALQLLFTADRAWHVHAEIAPALASGTIVVSDRYTLSTLAYGEALGLDAAWLANMNKNFIQPDCTILTLPPFDVCMQRIHERGAQDTMEVRGLQENVHAAYERLAQNDSSIIVIDTSMPFEASAARIRAAVRDRLF